MQWVVAEEKNRSSYRIRFSPDEKLSLDGQIERLGGPQFVWERLIRWFVDQEPEAQAMILGQIPASDELVALVLNRLKRKDVAGKIQPRVSPQDRKEAASKNLKK